MKSKYTLPLTLCLIFSISAIAKESKEPAIHGSIKVKEEGKSDYSNLAKISLNEAIKVASKKLSGRAREANLENEDGYLVYSVLVVTPKDGLQEVIVDAGNGKILATGAEDRSPASKINDEEEADND